MKWLQDGDKSNDKLSKNSTVSFCRASSPTGLVCIAGKYKKIDGLGKAAGCAALGATIQGVSAKARTPLGERSGVNWLADGLTLGLVAYGTKALQVAGRAQGAVGAIFFGSQLAISNIQQKTLFTDIDAMATKDDCTRVQEFISDLESNDYTPQELVALYDAFLLGGEGIMGYDHDNPIAKVLDLYEEQIDLLDGFEKLQAQMRCVEHFERYGHFEHDLIEEIKGFGSGDAQEMLTRDTWLKEVGYYLELKWAAQISLSARGVFGVREKLEGYALHLARESHRQRFENLCALFEQNGANVTTQESLTLCKLYFEVFIEAFNGHDFLDSPAHKLCKIIKIKIENLQGLAKAQAYMDFAELLYDNHCGDPELTKDLIPAVRVTLNPAGQAVVDQWLLGKGGEITRLWNP